MNVYSTAALTIILLFSTVQPTLSDPATTSPPSWSTGSPLVSTPTSSSPSTPWPPPTTSSGPTRPTPWPTRPTPSGSPGSTPWPPPTTSSGPTRPTPWPTRSTPTSSLPSTPWPPPTTSSVSPVTTLWPTRPTSSGSTGSTPWPSPTTSSGSTTPTSSGLPTSTTWSPGSTTSTTAAPSNITSIYSNTLNYNSPTFVRPGGDAGYSYYYQAIQMITYTRGTYSFRSSSSIDTYGCLYNGSFNPANPNQNLIACDDDSGGNRQFQINRTLDYGAVYILVVTTYSPGATGSYSVMAVGPATVNMTPYSPYSTITAWSTTSTSSGTTSSYAGSLDYSSPTFVRPGGNAGYSYYYQAIQVVTYTRGSYRFRSGSLIDTYGCLYDEDFDPSYPNQNLIACDDDSGGDYQFQINAVLEYGAVYTLVVTTYSPGATGSYSVMAIGPGAVSMTSMTSSTTVPWTTTTVPTTVTTNYSNSLQSDTPTFSRPNAYGDTDYHYQAIQVTVSIADSYTFTSVSLMDTYGCLYNGDFDASDSSNNLIFCNDDSGISAQFLITYYLYTSQSYTLVVTTSSASVTGSYTVQATGPARVVMTSITPSPSSIWTTVGIVIVSVTCTVVLLTIVAICLHRRKQRNPERQRLCPANRSPNRSAQDVFAPGSQGNRTLYAVPRAAASPPIVEEAPPSYEAFMAFATPPPPPPPAE